MPVKKEKSVSSDYRPKGRSGSKEVGASVKLTDGSVHHFPFGVQWKWARVMGTLMLEVHENSGGRVIFQSPFEHVVCVTGPSSVMPMWASRTYPDLEV